MKIERTITVHLTEEQAKEVKNACVDYCKRLEEFHQSMLNKEKPADEILKTSKRIDRLRRAERTIKEALGNE